MARQGCAGDAALDDGTVTTVAEGRPLGGRPWLLACALVAAVFVLYGPVWHAGFIWDDDDYVTNNTTLRTLDGLRRLWFEVGATSQYYPLTHSSFWLEYHLWQLNPPGYHVVNVSLHALNAVLLLLVLRKLKVNGPWIAAALFALHPVHVESVAWITERKNLLSGVFYLSALWAYLNHVSGSSPHGRDAAPRVRMTVSWFFYAMALVLYTAAVLSKSVASSLPVVILLLIWWKRGRLGWRDVLPLLPFLALGIAMGLTTLRVESQHGTFSFAERCLIAGRALWFYAGKLVWPANLTFVYPRWRIDPGAWWQYLYPATALGVVATVWTFRNRWGRGPLVAILCFVVTLAPAIGFFNVYYFRFSFVADHFDYLASAALLALAAAGVTTVARPDPIRTGAVTAVLFVFSALTWHRATVFQSNQKLWADTLNKNPESFIAHNNFGATLRENGQSAAATAHWREAARLEPDAWEPHMNLGKWNLDSGQYDAAVAEFREALRLNPRFPDPRYGLGMAYAKLGQYQQARAEFEAALRIKPDDGKAHQWLGAVLEHLGSDEAAIQQYLLAIHYEPTLADAYVDLGLLRQQRGDLDRAINCFQTAIRLRPDNNRARAALAALETQRQQTRH